MTILPHTQPFVAPDEMLLHTAALRGDRAEIPRLLKEGAVVDARDADGRTPLLLAVRAGHSDIARMLLEAGADVDARGATMQITPLMVAAQRGDVDSVALLLEKGADPNAVSKNGAGALARAVVADTIETATMLLDAGANPSGTGLTAPPNTAPLWVAVAMKRPALVTLLVERGAQINIGNSATDTLFGIAVSGGDAAIARMLLEAGADPSRPALANLPLLAVAMRFSNPPMAALLEEYGLSLAQS